MNATPNNVHRPPNTSAFISNNPLNNGILSVTNDAITINSPDRQRQPISQSVNTSSLRNGQNFNIQARQLSYMIHRQQIQRDSALVLGDYIRQLHDQLHGFLPQLLRTSEALQKHREIHGVENRDQASRLINTTSEAMISLGNAMASLAFLKDFELRNSEEMFGLRVNDPVVSQDVTPPPPNTQVNEEESEEDRVRRDREITRNMLGLLRQGVPTESTLEEISRLSGQESSDVDLVSLPLECLKMEELMQLMTGDLSVIDNHVPTIRNKFNSLIIKNSNNTELIIKELMSSSWKDLLKQIQSSPPEILFEGFDPIETVREIDEEYFPRFKEIILDQYSQTSEIKFSKRYTDCLKLYYGKVALDISDGMPDGLSGFHQIFIKAICDYTSKVLGPGLPIDSMIDSMIWPHVVEGYNTLRNDQRVSNEKKTILNKLNSVARLDEQVPSPQPLSDLYRKGALFKD